MGYGHATRLAALKKQEQCVYCENGHYLSNPTRCIDSHCVGAHAEWLETIERLEKWQTHFYNVGMADLGSAFACAISKVRHREDAI